MWHLESIEVCHRRRRRRRPVLPRLDASIAFQFTSTIQNFIWISDCLYTKDIPPTSHSSLSSYFWKKLSIGWLVDSSAGWLVDGSLCWLVRVFDWLVGLSVGWSFAGFLVDLSVDRLVGWFVGGLVDLTVDRLVWCLVGRLVSWFVVWTVVGLVDCWLIGWSVIIFQNFRKLHL